MPHQTIEYSANLEEHVNIEALVRTLHETAAGIDALPVGGLRTRAVARAHYCIADGHPDNQFVNIVLRIAPGRPPETKRAAGELLFRTACDFLSQTYEESPLAISFEIQELDAEYRWKQNNLREYIARRQEVTD